MQLMPATQNRFGVVNAFDPLDNITAGVAYLAWLLEEFDGDLDHTVAAYNAGENAVRGHGGVPPYSETREYVRRVNILYLRYRQSGCSAFLFDTCPDLRRIASPYASFSTVFRT